MRFLAYPISLTIVGLVVAGILGLVGLAGGTGPALPPSGIKLAFNFEGPRSVLICWDQLGKADVTSYDMQVTHWNLGRTRTEVVPRLETSDCGGAVGAGYTFSEDNLYHLSLRACNGARCSAWAEASPAETYWFQIPCANSDGTNCLFRAGDSGASGAAGP